MYEDDPGMELDDRIPAILKNKVFLIAAGAVLLLAVIGGAYLFFFYPDSAAPPPPGPTQPIPPVAGRDNDDENDVAEVLPQPVREDESAQEENRTRRLPDPHVDPFSDPMRLTAVVFGGRGGNMAVVESSGTSYIVAEGDYVEDLWLVRRITWEAVILRAYNQEVSLFLNQPPVTRTLDMESDNSSDEGGT